MVTCAREPVEFIHIYKFVCVCVYIYIYIYILICINIHVCCFMMWCFFLGDLLLLLAGNSLVTQHGTFIYNIYVIRIFKGRN
ncbi:uncharacterized protein BX664DRAFT_321447 [Halteromyces radiatus]|uniref:uncharacterized protein n=1 Tax=Halteromyces radiatus TaxID=101107 RepID=UPI002220276A|nr:uncharacterized protein BX664DRAFT_321447 [Halteromyces radiatus]KAI8099505.1 hypothetical protein BX664DRAFT_321447 [Halteromyces radiatus]